MSETERDDVADAANKLQQLIVSDDTDEKLYSMVREAKQISKAARIVRIATTERIDAETAYNAAKVREEAAMQALTRLILAVK